MRLDALTTVPLPRHADSPVVLMVSGGSDSTALLVRACTGELDLQDGLGPQALPLGCLCVLHVNHAIRFGASDGDERFVRDLAAKLGAACRAVRVDVPGLVARGRGGRERNLELVARQARYRAAWDLASELARERGQDVRRTRILVAHTADDQAETVLMRVLCGSGLTGLSGMRRQRGIVVRPLLDDTREGLRAYLEERDIGWREDATNDEDDATRSYVRHHVMPAMRARNLSFAAGICRMTDLLADDADLLDRMGAALLDRARRPGNPADKDYGQGLVPAQGAPRRVILDASLIADAEPALARRALRGAVELALGEDAGEAVRLESVHATRMLDLVAQGSGQITLPLDTVVSCEDGLVTILPASVRTQERAARLERARRLAAQGAPPQDQGALLTVPGQLAWQGSLLRARRLPVPEGADVGAFARQEAAAAAEELAAERGASPADIREGRDFALLDCPGSQLLVAGPQAGERMEPFGMGGHSKLVLDLLADARVPAASRADVPLVHEALETGGADAGQDGAGSPATPLRSGNVVWVAGIRPDGRFAYSSNTRSLLRLDIVFFDGRKPQEAPGATREGEQGVDQA